MSCWGRKQYISFSLWVLFDIKQIDDQIFLQQRWICWGSAENFSLGCYKHGEPHARKGECFDKEVQRAIINRIHDFSLAVLLPGKKRSCSFSCWSLLWSQGLPWRLTGKESACQYRRRRFDPWVGKIPWRRKWQPTPVFSPGNPMDRGAWRAIVYGSQKRHNLVTKNNT